MDDLIKRSDVMKMLTELQFKFEDLHEAKRALKNIPTSNEIHKHGNWLLLDECSNAGVYCSVCHKKVYKEDYANQKLKSKYCPNCGAIMDLDFEKC